MTTPTERTRAVVWAGGFLIQLARDERLPLDIRQRAIEVARHFPTVEDVSHMTAFQHPVGLGIGLAAPGEVVSWGQGLRFGPLRRSTRLRWPE